MITAARLQRCSTVDELFALLRELGYDVAPVSIAAAEWRRAGIDIRWNGQVSTHLAARTADLDLYVVSGDELPDDADVTAFLRSLTSYNAAVKPVLAAISPSRLTIHDLSPGREPRRLDVDPQHATPHALDRLNLLGAGDDAARIFDRALDRESLARQFFERFRKAVADVAAAMAESCPSEPRDAVDAQALLLLSRLLFLYFIQQKGWLNGERRFLVDRAGRDVYARLLRPLFFGCLNTAPQERDDAARALGDIPYLNGGLFEPSPFEQRNPSLALPDELLRCVLEDVFERFAFSIDETDSAGTHIDPEMLGNVFESLMATDERLATGSFYTPRAIVDVLATRAVATWLSEGSDRTRMTLEALARGETARVPRPAAALAQKLATIAVLDPACGSGAFLLAALRVIERLTEALGGDAGSGLRRRIVERSLFGVDLKPEAVRLCELRLWLAIVSRSGDDAASVQPLPNLDRNILQGNSLLAPTDFLGGNRADVYREWVYALRAQADLVARYRNAPHAERRPLARLLRSNDARLASELIAKAIDLDEQEQQRLCAPERDLFGRLRSNNVERCRELHDRIAANRKLLDRIEEGELAFFAFDVHFAPVMARGGFDVVVGNPPWVRNSRIEAETKRMLAERYPLFRGARGSGTAFHQPDLAVAFVERSLALANDGGVVSLLVPAKLLNAGYAAPLRAAMRRHVVALDDWSSDARRHFDADTFPLGMTLVRGGAPAQIAVASSGESFRMPRAGLETLGSEWALLPPDVHAIAARIHAAHPPLARALGRLPVMGVKTGDNNAFFLDVKRVRARSVETTDGLHIPLTAVCRCIRGRDVRRWRVEGEPAWMLWPPAAGWRKPPRWLESLAAVRDLDIASLRLSFVRPEHAGIKVVWKDLSRRLCAAAVADVQRIHGRAVPLVPNQTLYALDAATMDEAHVIAALLNSTIVNMLTIAVAERAKDFHFRYFGRTVARVPLPELAPSSSAWPLLLRAARKRNDEEVDRIVATLYGVSAAEQARLAEWLRTRTGDA